MLNTTTDRAKISALYAGRGGSIAMILAALAWLLGVVSIIIYFVAWRSPSMLSICEYLPWFAAIAIFFAIATPTWFCFEYYFLIDHTRMETSVQKHRYEHFRHGQTLAAAVWAAFGVVYFVLINHGFGICKGE